MLKFSLHKFLHNQESTWLVLDLVMLGLLVLNLNWLILDWLYETPWFPRFVATLAPDVGAFYAERVHPVFWKIDLAFVTLFLAEFLLRWSVAVRRRTYGRWYLYPLFHWYELLGCIPLATFRALRFLRVISMVYRLQKLGVLDLTDTAVARVASRWYEILVEEVSDRVVVNVLDGIQRELRTDEPVLRRIINEVVLTRKPQLVEAVGRRVEVAIRDHYLRHRPDVSTYVNRRIADAVRESEDIERLKRIPVFGAYGTRMLERAVAQIVFAVIDGAAEDLRSSRNRPVVEDLVSIVIDQLLQHDEHFDAATNEMLIEAIDVLKAQVRMQRWRETPLDPGA